MLTWCGSKMRDCLSVRGTYSKLILKKQWQISDSGFKNMWTVNVQIKLIIFMWLVWRNKNLTWKNLQKRGWHGPGLCVLSGENEEDNCHLFYSCSFAKETLSILCDKLHIQVPLFCST